MVRLYIIEDDEMIRNGLQDCFTWADHGVIIVGASGDGKVAFEQIRSLNVDVILTDVVLPGMTGIELAIALRESGWPGEIIMMSAFQDVDYLRAALRTQSVDFLFKPMKTDELAEAIRCAVHRVHKRRGVEVLSEREWKALLDDALKKTDPEKLKNVLQAAWMSIRFDRRPVGTLAMRAAEVFQICEKNVCLEIAEELCAEIRERILSAINIDRTARAYSEGSHELVEMLAQYASEWAFAVELTDHIISDLPNAEPNVLASKMHVSRAAFYRKFSHAFRSSLSDRIVQLRIRVACSLLENTTLRIYEVAEHLGYTDVNYFTRIFRQQIGMLPSKYRAQMNNIEDDESGGP